MSKHMKMLSKPPEGEDEEWLDESHQQNGKTQNMIWFSKGGRISQLTRLEKVFLVLIFLLAIALIAVIIALIIKEDNDESGSASNSSNRANQVCLTQDCVAAAAVIHSKLDYSVNPCDDFYQFACGRWMSGRVIPEDRPSVTIFSDLRNGVNIVLKNLLEKPIDPTEPDYIQKVKTLYASCMNTDLINDRGVAPLVKILNDELGGWPLISKDWKEADFDYTDIIIKLNTNNCFPMLSFYTSVDNKNSSKRILTMDQGGFGMPGQKYFLVARNDSMLMAYQNLIFGIGNLLGFADPSTAEKEVADIVDFEIELAKISVPAEERRNSNDLYNPMTLASIQSNYSEILDWKSLALNVTSMPGIDVTDITDDEIVINKSPSFYEKLIPLLKATPKRIVANFLLWRQVYEMSKTQGDEVKELLKIYKKVLYGVESQPPRYRTCVSNAMDNMGLAVGKLFIENNFNADSKTAALEMIQDLHHAFDEILDEIDWMDDTTKAVAKEKNSLISPKIGYPDQLTNETFMTEFYKNYSYEPDQFLENYLINARENYKSMMKQLRELVDKNNTLYAPPTVNAYYSWSRNQIMFPAGILQPPFFSKNFPKSLNYGGIGMVIGHEITHGFDDRGRLYDKEGNLVQWWSKSAEQKFRIKAQCIIDQYGNYTVDDINMNLNGITTQGENIADNGGLKQAFKAYRDWVGRRGSEEDRLPGLTFNNNQLFFINFAQLWCTLMRDGDAINRIRSGVHSPGKFRVIGTTQNSKEFSEVFQCPTTSKMNPKKKCSVW